MSSNVPVHINCSVFHRSGQCRKEIRNVIPVMDSQSWRDCVSSITHSTVVVFLVDVHNYSILQVSNFVQPAVIARCFPSSFSPPAVVVWQFYSIFVELLLAKTAFVIIVTLTVVVLSEN